MSNPTTPFSWQMPTATDLVTDLPADFEVFGQAVATSMADLLGGTSGQVLAKNSNTDMDFVWVTSDDANAIQNTIVDAKGDLIAASASDVPARLAVGSNGESLVADSAATTGLRYSATPSASNPVLNSAMQVWQRGTSISLSASSGAIFTADRWTFATNASQASTVSRQVTGDTTNLPNIQYCARVQRNSGQTGTGTMHFVQSFESVNSIPFAGKTVTMSFYARKGANYSPTSNALIVYLMGGTGTDQNRGGGTAYTGETYIVNNQTATLTATWQRFTYTGTVGATVTEMAPYFDIVPTGTAGVDDYFEITGVQIDIGSVALPFRTYAATIQGELAACQRYYQVVHSFTGNASTTTQIHAPLNFVMPMRTSPSVAGSAAIYVSDGTNDFTQSSTNVAFVNGNRVTSQNCQLVMTNFTGMTQWRSYMQVSTAGGDIQLSAEL
jgi:hypothetical protein